jgi:predicted nucleotidyltransferase
MKRAIWSNKVPMMDKKSTRSRQCRVPEEIQQKGKPGDPTGQSPVTADWQVVGSNTMKKDLNIGIEQIARRYRVVEMYAFGSRAKEVADRLGGEKEYTDHAESDVDMGVRIEAGASLGPSERVKLALEIEDLLEVSRVDLVILQEADPFLALEIIRGELVYAEDLDRQARYELYLLRRAGDLLPFKKERIRMIMEEGAR